MPQQQAQQGYGYGAQQPGMAANYGHPAFGGFINDPTAQLGFQVGKTALDASQQYMEQNVPLPHLQDYTINHQY